MFKLRRGLCIFVVCLISSQSWAWGTKGHQIIESVAARLQPRTALGQLIRNNIEGVKYISMVPDIAWKHGSVPHPLEGQAHFFNMDFYNAGGRDIPTNIDDLVSTYGMPNVVKNGTAPWRTQQFVALLVSTLKKSDSTPERILQIVSTLGHYVGDLGNPLHVISDYDGRATGKAGLHSYFETVTVNEMNPEQLEREVTEAAAKILAQLPPNLQPLVGAFGLATKASRKSSVVLNAWKDAGKTPTFQKRVAPTIILTLALSSAVLAKFWHEAYLAAGSPDLNTSDVGKITVPRFIPVSYLKGAEALFQTN